MDDHEREHYRKMIALYKSAAISGILAALAFATIAVGTIAYMVTR